MLLFEHTEERNVREMGKIDGFGLSPGDMHSAYGFSVGEVLSPCKLPQSQTPKKQMFGNFDALIIAGYFC